MEVDQGRFGVNQDRLGKGLDRFVGSSGLIWVDSESIGVDCGSIWFDVEVGFGRADSDKRASADKPISR